MQVLMELKAVPRLTHQVVQGDVDHILAEVVFI